MYKQSNTDKQLDLFSSIPGQLSGKSKDIFDDPLNWHNVFRSQYYLKIDESIFSVLYNTKMGCPNSPVNTLISMMILKEGFGWSDERLFEEIRFNALVRAALGIYDLSEAIPSESTYYLFRSRILTYEEKEGIDLISKVFEQLTQDHVVSFNVRGAQVRMDSKIFGGNLARLSRFGLVHKTAQLFCKELSDRQIASLPIKLQDFVVSLLDQEQEKIIYKSTSEEIGKKLQWLGSNICQLLTILHDLNTQSYSTLSQVFSEQFNVKKEEGVEPKIKEELKASNIQTPFDTDADYRKKGDTVVYAGYSANATETCSADKDGLDLITAPEVKPATAADNDFYQSGIEKTEQVTIEMADKVFTDGAYHSQENKKYNDDNDIDQVLTGLQGAEGRYSFEMSDADKNLIVTDKETKETYQATLTKKGKSYRFVNNEGKTCYINKQQVENFFFREQMESRDWEEKKKRNNVEATIFQLFYFTRNNKIRYRGIEKTKIWLFMRSLWVNCVRIKNYLTKRTINGTSNKSQYASFCTYSFLLHSIINNIILYFFDTFLRIQYREISRQFVFMHKISCSRGDIKN